ncbi:MAG: discoidin domain-containing protein [Oscillospiraceae bacterium]|nr:discoidin domain-containing protein [Oscillospiraceae bacterium]
MRNTTIRHVLKTITLSVLCCAVLAPAVSMSAEALRPMPLPASPPAAAAVSDAVSEEIGLVGNLFCIADSDNADHAALQWATTHPAASYVLYRSTEPENGFVPIYEGSGTSFTDNDMEIGKTYYYQLKATDGKDAWYSKVRSLVPCVVPEHLDTYDNQKGSSLVYETSGTKVGDTYYSYSLRSHSGQNDIFLAESTSNDGIHFGSERVVADKSQNADLASCKIESIHIEYAAKANKIIVWAHWEQPSGYNDGKALVITGTPGGEFTVHHVYNPLGIQVRDMAIFFDDDGTGYLIAAANKPGQGANATIYIFKMNDSFSDVTEIVKTLHEDQYREFPNLIKRDGYYFLFTSQAAGWYPSSGAYIVTDDLYGDWSELRSIGNTSTFSSQSGWVVNLRNKNYLMHAYRWLRAPETSGTTLCPLYFDNGFAFYDYYPSFRYSTKTGDLYPVQEGELLSQDKPATASLAAELGKSAAKAVDGSYQSAFAAIGDHSKWPFYLQVDLEQICDLANIQTSWYIHKGSEGYYTYTVETSLDGENWTQILDHTNKNSAIVNSTYGFNSDMLSGRARYVRLNVLNAALHNNPNNWYTPTVYEMKIFGIPVEKSAPPIPAVKYDFETANGSTIPDISGNKGDLQLFGSAKLLEDAVKGSVLHLDGTTDTYAQLPAGLLDGCRDYTVSMDVKSESTGDFFTFAAGKDRNLYSFFRVSEEFFRFATTIDTWRGESEMRYDLNGTQWHNYTFVVNGATAKLYVDGVPVSETTELTSGLTDMGSGLDVYIGKSFYEEDAYFNGYLDNVCIYRHALTAQEIAAQNPILGDVNADGVFSVLDVIAMQKYLLSRETLAASQNGDVSGDSRINAFDLAILKRMITAEF